MMQADRLVYANELGLGPAGEGEMIQYTGNPYVDAGVAVLEFRLGKPCDQFTTKELKSQAHEIAREYRKKIWKSYLMLHLPNCAWTQKNPCSKKNREYLRKVLRSYKPHFATIGRSCAFCGRPAKLLADRRYVPLLTGETVMTTGAGGTAGLPVCGYCIFAVQFYPFATLKVEARPLFWWAPDRRWTRRLNARFYNDVQRILAGSSEQFIKLRWPATQLLRAAREVMGEIEKLPNAERPPLCDVVGIHATNFGTEPNFDELRIPRGLLEFWSEAGTWELYREIEREAWTSEPSNTGKAKQKTRRLRDRGANTDAVKIVPELTKRNILYEALGEAFRTTDHRDYEAKAKQVALRFFLRRQGKDVAPNTIALAEFFLEKVGHMEKERLEAIREMADTVAERLILGGGDRRVAWQLFQRRLRLGEFLQCLSKIQRKLSDMGHPLKWDHVLIALGLTNEEDRTSSDHWLVQELMLIRLYERLAESDVLTEVPESEDIATLEIAE